MQGNKLQKNVLGYLVFHIIFNKARPHPAVHPIVYLLHYYLPLIVLFWHGGYDAIVG